MLAGVFATLRFVVLVLAVNGFVHTLLQQALTVFRKQRVPVTPPHDLNHIPACTTELAFQFLNNLTVTTHRTIQSLQVAVNNENKILKLLAPCKANRTQCFWLITFAVTQERPHLPSLTRYQFTSRQVTHKVRLINCL